MYFEYTKDNLPRPTPNAKIELYNFDIPQLIFNDSEDEGGEGGEGGEDGGAGKTILVVCDRICKEINLDWLQRPPGVLNQEVEQVVINIVNWVRKTVDTPIKSITFMNYPYFYVEDKRQLAAFKSYFNKRVARMIRAVQPNLVLLSGLEMFNTLGHVFRECPYPYQNQINRVFTGKSVCGSVTNTFKFLGTVSLQQIASQQSDDMKKYPNLIGYFVGGLTTLLEGRNRYTIDVKNRRCIYIDSIKKFNKFYKLLVKGDQIVALDTEGQSLNRLQNTLYSLQASFDGKTAFFVPLFHPKTPFNASELKYITDKLRYYFEYGKSYYHVWQNANFDITVFKIFGTSLGVRHYNHRIADTIALNFGLEENRKFLSSAGIPKPYRLDSLCEYYGCTIYREIAFSKEDRNNMATTVLSDALIDYACVDVLTIYQMANICFTEAKRRGYKLYKKLILYQMSHTIKAFSAAEHTGINVDKRHLLHLMSRESPLRKMHQELVEKLKTFPECQQANNLLLKRLKLPVSSGWNNKTTWVLDFKKQQHKQLLFFEVLGLKPLAMAKNGKDGKLDKKFYEKYADNPVVKAFQSKNKLETLINTFVGSTTKGLYGFAFNNPDAKVDGRIRPNFSFQDVISGRVSAKRPTLQNLAERSKEAEHVKRILIASEGCLLVELDMSSHEVREWGNLSKDVGMCKRFATALVLKLMFRLKTNQHLKNEVLDKGDIHRANYYFFYGRYPKDKAERDSIKTTVFGTVYGMSAAALAAALKISEESAQHLIDLMFTKFKKGGRYLRRVEEIARRHLKVISPNGRVRHLWGYLHNRRGVHNAMDRRAGNSLIQGFSSDLPLYAATLFNETVWHFFVKHEVPFNRRNVYFTVAPNNYIHDSLKNDIPVHLIPIAMYLLEHCCTTLIHREFEQIFGHKMLVGLELEFGIGASSDSKETWDWNIDVPGLYKTKEEKGNIIKIPTPCLLDIMKNSLKKAALLYPDYWTKTRLHNAWKLYMHNLTIVTKIRKEEIKQTLRKKQEVPKIMIMNEGNARDFGLIFDSNDFL